MPANFSPIFPLTPNAGANNVLLSTAMTNTKAFDGTEATGTAMALAFTAGANGARIDRIIVRPSGTNGTTASGTTSQTILRYWLNNGAANTTATNNQLWGEILVPATAVASLATTALSPVVVQVDLSIPAGYRLYIGSTIAIGGTNCALSVTTIGGDY